MSDASDAKEDRAENVDILSVEIVPNLTIAIEHATTVHIHIFTSELEEGGSILEGLVEGVGLPVVRIIGKLDIGLNI